MTHAIVLGGGVAGLTVAHELVSRGFQVSVYERLAELGGKARSTKMPVTGLPGEHGFRFFGSFYRHLDDTLGRIDSPVGGKVSNRLLSLPHGGFGRFGQPLVLNSMQFPTNFADLQLKLTSLFGNAFGVPQNELNFVAERVWQIATSCPARCLDEYESISWWDFIEASTKSPQFQAAFAMVTHSFVAGDPKKVSARTMGSMAVQSLLGTMTPGKVFERVLDGPTSEVWIDPWVSALKASGVLFHLSADVEGLVCVNKTIDGVKLRGQNALVKGDEYVSALPVEVLAGMLDPALLAAAPALANLQTLASKVSWMTGIQFYLTEKVDLIDGHILYLGSPWALTAISQRRFWPRTDLPAIGGLGMQSCISVNVSNWFAPGMFVTKHARQCTRAEIESEIWQELQGLQDHTGAPYFAGIPFQHAYLDPAIGFDPSGVVASNSERLLVNEKGTWSYRPKPWTAIANFWLAGDYVQTATDIASMESANEAARLAVNAILAKHGVAGPCATFTLPTPALLGPLVALDQLRYSLGQPWSMYPI